VNDIVRRMLSFDRKQAIEYQYHRQTKEHELVQMHRKEDEADRQYIVYVNNKCM
jgi:hypothetical protein